MDPRWTLEILVTENHYISNLTKLSFIKIKLLLVQFKTI